MSRPTTPKTPIDLLAPVDLTSDDQPVIVPLDEDDHAPTPFLSSKCSIEHCSNKAQVGCSNCDRDVCLNDAEAIGACEDCYCNDCNLPVAPDHKEEIKNCDCLTNGECDALCETCVVTLGYLCSSCQGSAFAENEVLDYIVRKKLVNLPAIKKAITTEKERNHKRRRVK